MDMTPQRRFTATIPIYPAAAPTLSSDQATDLADRFKALGDPNRLRMLDLLAHQPAPLCVCEITAQFALSQPTISHHLRVLREAGLVDCEKRGVWAYYWATTQGQQIRGLMSILAS